MTGKHILARCPNEKYEQDVKYVTKQTYVLLRIIGIWSLHEGQLSVTQIFCKLSVMAVCCVLVCCDLALFVLSYMLSSEEDTQSKLKLIAPIVYIVNAFAKYVSLITHEHEIRSCVRHVKNDWRFLATPNARNIMMKNVKAARNMFTICCSFLYCTGLLYQLAALSAGVSINNDTNVSLENSSRSDELLFDEQRSPAFEICFMIHFLSGFIMYTVTIVIYGLASIFLMHACAQMKILMILMKNLVKEEACKEKIVNENMTIVIEHQARIRSFVFLVENTLHQSSLFDILGSTILLCFVGYCFVMEWQDGNTANACSFLVALVTDTINIFILCYIGEHITETANQVALTANTLEWYRLPQKRVRDIVLIVIMSHIPLKVTAGKIIGLSFKTFGDVIKSAVMYFNILRTITD